MVAIKNLAALYLWHFLEGQERLLQTAAFLSDSDHGDFT